jgi:hypothetical protein
MSVLTQRAGLPAVPPYKFTRLSSADFSGAELDTLGCICEFTGLSPSKVTMPIAEAFLQLVYNLPKRHRESAAHLRFVLALAQQALTMLRRCEIERFVSINPAIADEAREACNSLRAELEQVCVLLKGTT